MRQKYKCWLESDEETASYVMADSPGTAAEVWAESYDWNSTEFQIAKGDGTIIVVQRDGCDLQSRLNVTAYTRPTYTAAGA